MFSYQRCKVVFLVFAALLSNCDGRKLYVEGQNEEDDSLDCDDGGTITNPVLAPYVLKLKGEEMIPQGMKDWIVFFDVDDGDPERYFREEDGWKKTYLTELGLGDKEEDVPYGRIFYANGTSVYSPPTAPIVDAAKEFKVMYAEQLLLDEMERVKIYIKYDPASNHVAKLPKSSERLLQIFTSRIHPKIINVIAAKEGLECNENSDNPLVTLATCGSVYNRTMGVKGSDPKEAFPEDYFVGALPLDFDQSTLPEFEVELPVAVKRELQTFLEWLLKRIGQRMHSYMEMAFLKNRFQKSLMNIYDKVNLQISKIKGGKTFAAAKSSLLMFNSLFDLSVYLNVTNTPYAFDKFNTINSYLHFIGRFTKWRLDTTKYANFFEPLKKLCTNLIASGNNLLRSATNVYEEEEGIFRLTGAICHEKILFVVGEMITMTTIKAAIYDNLKSYFDTVFVLAEKNITINEDLIIPGKNLIVYAPVWFIAKQQVIDLSGEDGSSVGEGGSDGGDFFGVGIRFEKNYLLKVVSNGGSGQAGRDSTKEVFDQIYMMEADGECKANEASLDKLWNEHGAILAGPGGSPGAVTIKMTKQTAVNITIVRVPGTAGHDGQAWDLALVCKNNKRVVIKGRDPRKAHVPRSLRKMNETEVMLLFRKVILKNFRRLPYSFLIFYKDIWTSHVMGQSLDSTLREFLLDLGDYSESKEFYEITSQILHNQIAQTCNITDAQKVLLNNVLAIIRMKSVEDGVLPTVIHLNEYLKASSRILTGSDLDETHLEEEEAKFRSIIEISVNYLEKSLEPSLIRTRKDVHMYLQRNLKSYLIQDGMANDDKIQDYFMASVLFKHLNDIFTHIRMSLNNFAEKDKSKLPDLPLEQAEQELDTNDMEKKLYFFRYVRNNITANEMKAMNGFLGLIKKVLIREKLTGYGDICTTCKEQVIKIIERLQRTAENSQSEGSYDVFYARLMQILNAKSKPTSALVRNGMERDVQYWKPIGSITQVGTFIYRLFCLLHLYGCTICSWRRDCVNICQNCQSCSECPWCVQKCFDANSDQAKQCSECKDESSPQCQNCIPIKLTKEWTRRSEPPISYEESKDSLEVTENTGLVDCGNCPCRLCPECRFCIPDTFNGEWARRSERPISYEESKDSPEMIENTGLMDCGNCPCRVCPECRYCIPDTFSEEWARRSEGPISYEETKDSPEVTENGGFVDCGNCPCRLCPECRYCIPDTLNGEWTRRSGRRESCLEKNLSALSVGARSAPSQFLSAFQTRRHLESLTPKHSRSSERVPSVAMSTGPHPAPLGSDLGMPQYRMQPLHEMFTENGMMPALSSERFGLPDSRHMKVGDGRRGNHYGGTFPREFRDFERSQQEPFLFRQFRSIRGRETLPDNHLRRVVRSTTSPLRENSGDTVGKGDTSRTLSVGNAGKSRLGDLAKVKAMLNVFLTEMEESGCDAAAETRCHSLIGIFSHTFFDVGDEAQRKSSPIHLNCPECTEFLDHMIQNNNEEIDKCLHESNDFDYIEDEESTCSSNKRVQFSLNGCDPETYSRVSSNIRQKFLKEFFEVLAKDEKHSNELKDIKHNFEYLLANINSFLQEGFSLNDTSINNFLYVTDSSKIFYNLKNEYKRRMSELYDFYENDMYQVFTAELAMQNEKLGMIAKWINQMKKLVPWINKVTEFLNNEPKFHEVTEKILGAVRLVSEINHNLKIIERYRELRFYMKRLKGIKTEGVLTEGDKVRLEMKSIFRKTILKDIYDKSVRMVENSMFPLSMSRAEAKRLLLAAKNDTYVARLQIMSQQVNKFKETINSYTVKHEDIPIYEWKVRTRPSLVDDIFSGKPVILVSEILDGGRKNSVAAKDFRLVFVADRRQAEGVQEEINNALARTSINFTHSGISYFKFGSRIYRRLTEAVTFRQRGDGTHSEKQDIDFDLSPYTTWILRVKTREKLKFPLYVKNLIGSIRLLGTVRYITDCEQIPDVNQYFVPLRDYKRRNGK